jgi:hypothetical protein
MKKTSTISLALLTALAFAPACGDSDGEDTSATNSNDDTDGGDGESTSGGDGDSGTSDSGNDGTTDGGDGDTGSAGCADPNDPNAEKVGVDADIDADTTWSCDKIYILQQHIYVHATLTIEAGTRVQGLSDSAMVVDQDGVLNVNGTESDPVVMTSNSDSPARGDWGGLVLLGDAPTNLGAPGVAEGFVDAPEYGGDDAAHNCGSLNYLRVEYAGFEISDGNELNGITFYACGSDTEMHYVQSHMGQDDGIEWFGGGFNADHLIVTGAADDSLDIDQGFSGNIQHVFIHQDPSIGDNCYEISNQGDDFSATPRTSPIIANATCVGSGTGGDKSKGMTLKEGTNGQYWNSIITNATNEGVLLTHPESQAEAEAGNIAFAGTVLAGNGVGFNTGPDATWTGADLQSWIEGQTANITDTAPALGSAEWGNPDIMPADGSNVIGNGQTLPSGFDATDYSGAVEPGGTDWTQAGWANYVP